MNEFSMTLPTLFARENKIILKCDHLEETVSFNTLFIPEKKALYNFILKSVNFSEDANDIYQETALRSLKYFKKFDSSKKFKPWLFAIAVNEIKKHFKTRGENYRLDSIEQIFDQIPDDRNKKLAEAVYSAAGGLKIMEREIFFLFYDSGFTITEISELTGKSRGNIKVILSNSRKKIRVFLRDNR